MLVTATRFVAFMQAFARSLGVSVDGMSTRILADGREQLETAGVNLAEEVPLSVHDEGTYVRVSNGLVLTDTPWLLGGRISAVAPPYAVLLTVPVTVWAHTVNDVRRVVVRSRGTPFITVISTTQLAGDWITVLDGSGDNGTFETTFYSLLGLHDGTRLVSNLPFAGRELRFEFRSDDVRVWMERL